MKVITSGCYFLYNNGIIVYVGESNNVFGRIGEHIREGSKIFDEFEFIECNEEERQNMETFLIDIIKPKYNLSRGKGNIKIQKAINNNIKSNEKKYKDFCINIYNNVEKNIDIKRLEELLEITYPRLMIFLEELKAPLFKDNITNHFFINKYWLYNNLKELYKKYENYLMEE